MPERECVYVIGEKGITDASDQIDVVFNEDYIAVFNETFFLNFVLLMFWKGFSNILK